MGRPVPESDFPFVPLSSRPSPAPRKMAAIKNKKAGAGTQFNRKYFGLSFALKNSLRFHFDSESYLNYPFLTISLV